MNPADYRSYRDLPPIAGITTMTEAIDDVHAIRGALSAACIADAFVHADAALAGIPLALLPRQSRPGFDLADGADCVSVSGHKFVGSPFPCGVVLTRRSISERVGRPIDYIGSVDSTICGSRCDVSARSSARSASRSAGASGRSSATRCARSRAARATRATPRSSSAGRWASR